MAKILPEHPVGEASAAFLRIHRLVESLPEGYVAWSPLVRGAGGLPDFWIVEEASLKALVLMVSEVSEDQARGPDLLEGESAWTDPVVTETVRIGAAREALGVRAMRGAVVFPDVPKDLLPGRVDGWPRAGRETCRPAPFAAWIASLMGDPLEPSVLQSVRSRFSPESVLMAGHVMRREAAEPPTPRFLTWKQEEILKADLEPPDEGRKAAGDFGLMLVQGVAGSGKSLVLLHRALLLSRLRPRARMLVLTCNKPLQVELARRFAEMSGGVGRVEFLTFHAFCLRRWPDRNRPRMVETPERRLLHERALASLERPVLLRRQLEEEFAWIFDHGFPDEESYAAQPRRGRGFRMDASLRARFWKASREHLEGCRARGEADWSLLPLLFRDALQECDPDRYETILVDEAQFFAPVWFDCIRRFLSPGGSLFLVADPSQGFLRRGQSWRSAGLAVQGRSHRLERSHRSTGPVMELAWRLWNARAAEADNDAVEPRLDGMVDGPEPVWYRFPDMRSEHAWIEEQVASFVGGGGRPGDVLVLHEDWAGAQDLLERLRDRLGAGMAVQAREGVEGEPPLRVCTLNAATGLESPVVFVVGAQRVFEREGSPDLDGDERIQARDEATRKFHMAITRAGWRLVVTSSGPLPPEVSDGFRREKVSPP
jgi:hypothetical protein